MVTVACVFWGNKFSTDYVLNLQAMVKRNTTVDHQFVCFSDRVIPGVKTKILKPGFEGWWNKLQLFDNFHGIKGRLVYLDLDTVITNNIDWLLQYDGPFMGIEDLGSVNAHQPHLKNRLQTGVMSFDTTKYDWVWLEFMLTKDMLVQKYRGDGEYLNDLLKTRNLMQRLYPDQVKSYKYDVYPDKIDKSSIVCFHGRPSIIQAMTETIQTPRATFHPQQWIKDYWNNE